MISPLLFLILRQNVSFWQLLSFVLANLIGGFIVLVGLQAWRDADRLLASGGNALGSELLVISKPVGGLSAMTSMLGLEPRFSEAEVSALAAQPSVNSVGAFVPARCQVRGQIAVGALNMVTDMFLESVPDTFIDVPVGEGQLRWSASIHDPVVPIIIPRSYLNLYNYGYASTRGLPQMSEGLVSSFPLRLMLQGQGESHTYEARIVGFSDRINTILAPQDFIGEVNATMQSQPQQQPSRLIVSTRAGRANSQQLLQHISAKGYVVEGDADAVRMQMLVHGVLMALIGVGLLVTLLAFYLLVVSILLLIQRNRERLQTLSLLGYPVGLMARPYQIVVCVADVTVWLLSTLVVCQFYPRVTDLLTSLSPGFIPAPLSTVFLAATGFILLFASLHCVIIWSGIRSNSFSQGK